MEYKYDIGQLLKTSFLFYNVRVFVISSAEPVGSCTEPGRSVRRLKKKGKKNQIHLKIKNLTK